MAETMNLHVNALFSSYVETERAQERLAQAGDDAGAEVLTGKALALRDDLLAIRDRSGCADLVAARLLLELMLGHSFHAPTMRPFDPDDIEDILPMLEILADRLTGEVRRQAALALSTIGVAIDVEPEAEPVTDEADDSIARLKAALQDMPSVHLAHVHCVAEIMAAGGDPSDAIRDALPADEAAAVLATLKADRAG